MTSRRVPVADRLRLCGTTADRWTSAEVVAALAVIPGISESAQAFLFAVGVYESGYVVGMENVNQDGSIDRGPWQINSIHTNVTPQQAHTLGSAALAAGALYRAKGETPWVARTKVTREDRAVAMDQVVSTRLGNEARDRIQPTPQLPGDRALEPHTTTPGHLSPEPGHRYGDPGYDKGPSIDDMHPSIIPSIPGLPGGILEVPKLPTVPGGDLLANAGKALRLLTDASFWRRAGLVVVGVLVALVALSLIVRQAGVTIPTPGVSA